MNGYSKPSVVFAHGLWAGRIWLLHSGIGYFCGDLPLAEQQVVWAEQGVPDVNLFNLKAERAAWKSKPSWYIVGKNDRTVNPELERFVAKRMGATTFEVENSHVPMLSKPEVVIDVIRKAAESAQRSPAGRT